MCKMKYINPANPVRNFCKQKLRPLPVLFICYQSHSQQSGALIRSAESSFRTLNRMEKEKQPNLKRPSPALQEGPNDEFLATSHLPLKLPCSVHVDPTTFWTGLAKLLKFQNQHSIQSSLGSVHASAYIASMIINISKGGATSWLLKSTSTTTFTMWNNRERSPGVAPLPPDLMNIYSEKKWREKSWKNWLEYSCPGL